MSLWVFIAEDTSPLTPGSPEECVSVTIPAGECILCFHFCLRELWFLQILGSIFIHLPLTRKWTWPRIPSEHPFSARKCYLFQGHSGTDIVLWYILGVSYSLTCNVRALLCSGLSSSFTGVFILVLLFTSVLFLIPTSLNLLLPHFVFTSSHFVIFLLPQFSMQTLVYPSFIIE